MEILVVQNTMEGLVQKNNTDNIESSDHEDVGMFAHFKTMNNESPDYTLAKMTTYATEFQKHAKEKLTEAEKQLSVLEANQAAARVAIEKQVQRALAFINSWKHIFMKELEEEFNKKKDEVIALKQNLSNNNEMLLKAIFRAQVCLASKRDALTEDQCYDYLTGLMEPADHIIQTCVHGVIPPVFVPNEEFEEDCMLSEVRHSLGYVESFPCQPKGYQLEEVPGIHGTFKVIGLTKPMDKTTKSLLVWQVESWCSGARGKVMTVTGEDTIALCGLNVAPGLYLIAAKVFHQHVKCSPKAINYVSVKDGEVQHTSQDLPAELSPNICPSVIEVIDTPESNRSSVFESRDSKRSRPPSLQEIIVEDEVLMISVSDDSSSTSTVEFLDEKPEKSVEVFSPNPDKDLMKAKEGNDKLPRKSLGKLVSRNSQLSEFTSLRKPRKVTSGDVAVKSQKIGECYTLIHGEQSSHLKGNGNDFKLPGTVHDSKEESKAGCSRLSCMEGQIKNSDNLPWSLDYEGKVPALDNPFKAKDEKLSQEDMELIARNNMALFIHQKLKARLIFQTAKILRQPVGLTELSNQNILVADTFNDRMVIFTPSGRYCKQFTAPGGLRRPSAIVSLEENRVAVKDNHSITVFTKDGEFIRKYAENNLFCPYGLTKDSNGNLVTMEVRPDDLTLVTLDINQGTIKKIPVHLPQYQVVKNYSKPRFLTWQDPNTVLVVDLGMDCVYMVNPDTGDVFHQFGQFGKTEGNFHDPSGIACDKEGYIFVGDSRNHRIQVFDKKGVFLGVLQMDVLLNRPSGLHLCPDGNLLVLNYWDNTVAKYSLETC